MLSITHAVSEIKIHSNEQQCQQAASHVHVFGIKFYLRALHYFPELGKCYIFAAL